MISQTFTNGHNLRRRQNDEVVERLLGICGYINFLEANTDEDAYKFLWSLYAIRYANTAIRSTTFAKSPEKKQGILNQQQDGEIEEEKNEGEGGKAEKEEELSNIVNAGDRPRVGTGWTQWYTGGTK